MTKGGVNIYDCNHEHDHIVTFRGEENKVLCFQCAVKEAMLGRFIEAVVEVDYFPSTCTYCGR